MKGDSKLDIVEITPRTTTPGGRRMLPSKKHRHGGDLPALPADYQLPAGSGTVASRKARFKFTLAGLLDVLTLGPWRRR